MPKYKAVIKAKVTYKAICIEADNPKDAWTKAGYEWSNYRLDVDDEEFLSASVRKVKNSGK